MPRKAKPFKHQGYYYTTSGGTWTKLCPLSDGLAAAEAALARLLGGAEVRIVAIPVGTTFPQ